MSSIDMDWVEIPAGEFIVGLDEKQKRRFLRQIKRQVGGIRKLFGQNRQRLQTALSLLAQVRGQQRMHLDTFLISRFPVTLEQYASFQRRSGFLVDRKRDLELGGGKLPAMVRYDDALAFCYHLGGRLPTSDEWEKAARGSKGLLYPWGDEWDSTRANVVKKLDRKPRDVGSGPGTWTTEVDAFPTGQSSYGIWDLVGNVAEWTASCREYSIRGEGNAQARVTRSWPIKYSDNLAWLFNHYLCTLLTE